jgi:SAM-dependent methyltransferase
MVGGLRRIAVAVPEPGFEPVVGRAFQFEEDHVPTKPQGCRLQKKDIVIHHAGGVAVKSPPVPDGLIPAGSAMHSSIPADRPHATLSPPSPWVVRFAPLVPGGGPVLDLACGAGRHLRHFAAGGHPVVGLDRDLRGVADLAGREGVELIEADLEDGSPWPLAGRRFAGIVVTNYLHRPIIPALLDALAPKGVLIYETFAVGNGRFGRPSSPSFLLRNGELLELTRDRLQSVAYEHGEVASPKAAVLQRLCAVNDLAPAAGLDGDPEPYPLPYP